MAPQLRKKQVVQPKKKAHDKKREESPAASSSCSDSEEDFSDEQEDEEDYKRGGYHRVRCGEKFKDGRYTVLHKLGWGHFSTVWMVRDEQTAQLGAMKVVKAAAHYTEAARDEITLLSQIAENDPEDSHYCCRMVDWFEHSGAHGRHVCMVFEVLGDNLLTLIRLFAHRGIPLPAVRHLARQVLVALDYLHTTCRIIHTDLKPENVMLTEPVKPRRIDRGGGPTADQPLAGGERGDSQPPAAPSVAAPQPAAPSGGRPSKLQAVMAAGQPLTRNQKKKLKAKAKKKGGEGGSEASASMADSGITSDTSGGVVQGQEASSGEAGGAQAAAPAAAANGTHPPSQPQQQQRAEAAAAVDAANAPLQQAGADPSLAAEADQPADLERAASGRGSPPVAVDLKDLADRLMQMDCKIVDFGNACWTHKHFTDDIQTRQYRSPEVILGAGYDASADIWSLACMVFELVTGDFLFEPKAGRDYSRDEDHMAQMIELLDRMPRSVATTGRYARELFTREGRLRHIQRLNYWPLERVLEEKYKLPRHEAQSFADFLLPMLNFVPSKRATAGQMLRHPWLRGEPLSHARPAEKGGTSRHRSTEGRSQAKQRSTERSRSRSRSPKRSRSPSPTPPKGYRHHSPGAAPGAQPPQQQQHTSQQQQAVRSNGGGKDGSLSSSGMSAGTASPLPPVAALDLTASTVLLTAVGSGATVTSPPSPRPVSPAAPAAVGATKHQIQQQCGSRKSFDSNSSGQSWELVPGEGGTMSPA
ncbi:hypothetical protein D9Q98_008359 [Chlorella vulgaris]|uniref:non-specific serine/threonine protein kinase n=1 Tax=Chlorella vulgaris TaxID=3077 RepID=A0A9D4TGK4_CHLVU|nr:hypothetical protein D9Q98_008359 [Chlorella vulgaris]